MTRAERLEKLIIELKEEINKVSLFEFWRKYFNVVEITAIYEHLIVLKKEILLFEKEITKFGLKNNSSTKKVLHLLNSIVDKNSLSTINKDGIYHQSNFIAVLDSFEMIKVIYRNEIKEDNIPKNEFDELKKSVDEMIKKIESSKMLDEEKIAFLEFFNDINKSLSIYKISGINGFFEVVQKNICKIKLLEDILINEDKNAKKEYIDFAKNVVGTIGGWTIRFLKKKAKNTAKVIENTFDNEIVLYLENKLNGLKTKENTDEKIEEAEVLEDEEN